MPLFLSDYSKSACLFEELALRFFAVRNEYCFYALWRMIAARGCFFMATISLDNVHFMYEGFYEPIFTGISCDIDSSWKLGLVGRNGMGKTTLLHLMLGAYAYEGSIRSPMMFDYFPFSYDEDHTALQVCRETIAPFAQMEAEMLYCEERMASDEVALERYGIVQEEYLHHDGYSIDQLIEAEVGRLGVRADALERPMGSLSGGERTKLMLAALFLKKDYFLLIDEPTDHLDLAGRRQLAAYLQQKKGFIIVSHDRRFLDDVVDHIMVLEKERTIIRQGSFSSYVEDKQREDQQELERNERLEQQIDVLERSARQKASWSSRLEATKFGSGPVDRGYIGTKAARMMQLAKNVERRQERAVEEKRSLLRHIDYAPDLRITTLPYLRRPLVEARDLTLSYGEEPLFAPLTFALREGDRIALAGVNGTGKSTLLSAIMGQMKPLQGSLAVGSSVKISHVAQETADLAGDLSAYALRNGLDEALFKAILRKLDFLRIDFEKDMRQYSSGEKKKVLLAASLADPSHLYLWDEPLNFVDYYSREQILRLLLTYQPTMMFIEHDSYFCEAAALSTLELKPYRA